MLVNHYPLAFATEYNWLIASLVFLMGVTIRHYFNSKHARSGDPIWTWLATTLLFIAIMWLSTLGPISVNEEKNVTMSAHEQRFARAAQFEEVKELVQGRCIMCHAQEPEHDGFILAPKDVKFETDAEIASQAREIYLQAGRSRAMPPPAAARDGIELSARERQILVTWYEAAVKR